MKPFIVIGAGGHARVVIDALRSIEASIAGVLDIAYDGEREDILGSPVLGGLDVLAEYPPGAVWLAIAVGDNIERRAIFDRYGGDGYEFPPVIHVQAVVSDTARLGSGSFVNVGAIVNARVRIGENCIVNTGSILDHETVLGDHSHVAPGVRVAGRVTIGGATFVGIGTSIIDGVRIGDGVIVGAGSVVIDDLESGFTYAGVPARRIR